MDSVKSSKDFHDSDIIPHNVNYININDSPYKHFKLSPKRTESSNYYEELKTAEKTIKILQKINYLKTPFR